ncbi:putative aryl-alcohol dehydrogenase aad14 [Marasmius crinis-equi]|uniref:Aryl-alcohol dehydrogenase aad14 n=1 Tax=Marasmius crinis-equi TaxID=585013 RepID=A0ABR3FAY8_9AGAR
MAHPASEPPSKLGYLRTLSSRAGIHVSPLCLGAMSIGDQWSGLGSMDKEASFKLLDAYYDMGGNFIDTSNNYQDETSEKFIGEWAEQRGIRDQLVIATKYSSNYKRAASDVVQKAQYAGNSIKSMYLSVEDSLKKLRTSYIDILYVHWWDWDTSVEEVMDGLHHLVAQRKVLYLGISDTPAWVVAQANTYAKCMGKTPFVIYQGLWNVKQRDLERDILPMARSFGLAIAPWGVVGQGKFRTEAENRRRAEQGETGRKFYSAGGSGQSEDDIRVSAALEKVANELGAKNINAVAIAYVLQKTPYVFPMIGGRKIEHLVANLEALDIDLSDEHMKYLEGIVPLDVGFPYTMIVSILLGSPCEGSADTI